jgi:hypothetical protein
LLAPHAGAGLTGLQVPTPLELLEATELDADELATDELATDELALDEATELDTDELALDEVVPLSGAQALLMHDSPSKQGSPQKPQLLGSSVKSTQSPAHSVMFGAHAGLPPTPPAPGMVPPVPPVALMTVSSSSVVVPTPAVAQLAAMKASGSQRWRVTVDTRSRYHNRRFECRPRPKPIELQVQGYAVARMFVAAARGSSAIVARMLSR